VKPEQARKLREPFPPEQIGKLPKPTKKDNPKGKCAECGGYHGLPAVHLDFVGHAATTDRLLQVDPEWTWEPMARGPNGEPLIVNGGLWIWLTVCGVRRPGWGDGENTKVMIGDAIRNAAMRFGVALDLWAKEDLSSEGEPREQRSSGQTPRRAEPSPSVTPDTAELERLLREMGKSEDEIKLIFDHHKGLSGGQIKPEWVKAQTAKAKKHLETLAKAKAA
jgi:hypothetical protein